MGHPHTLVLASSFTIAHPRTATKMPTILLATLFAYALSKFRFRWIQIVYESLIEDTTSIRFKMDKKTSVSNDFYIISYLYDNVSREKPDDTIRYGYNFHDWNFCKFLNSLSNERERKRDREDEEALRSPRDGSIVDYRYLVFHRVNVVHSGVNELCLIYASAYHNGSRYIVSIAS